MVRVKHTEWPACRVHEAKQSASNQVKEGGLWHADKGTELLKEANRLIKPKCRDEVRKFLKIFWMILGLCVVWYVLFQMFYENGS